MPNNNQNGNGVNVYGGRRNPNQQNKVPSWSYPILTRIILLTVQLCAVFYLTEYINNMSPNDALKVRTYLLTLATKFVYIVQTYFYGYAKVIEATAITITSMVWSKLSSGKGFTLANIPVAGATFALAYTSRSQLKNLITSLNQYNQSWVSKLTGRTQESAEQMRQVIVAMISTLLASLRSSSLIAVRDISNDVLEKMKISSLSRRQLLPVAARQAGVPLAITNGANQRQTVQQRQAPTRVNNNNAAYKAAYNAAQRQRQTLRANVAARKRQARLRRFV